MSRFLQIREVDAEELERLLPNGGKATLQGGGATLTAIPTDDYQRVRRIVADVLRNYGGPSMRSKDDQTAAADYVVPAGVSAG